MKKNNKIGLLVAVMLLGIYNIPQNTLSAQAKTEGFIITADEQKVQEQPQIKANKDTFEKAKTLMDEKNYNEAIEYLTAYINGKPKRYEAYKLRGECYYALRRYDLAREDFQTAVNIKTSDDKFATGAKVVGAVVLGADKNDQKQNVELGNLYGQLMYAQKALNDPEYEDTYKKAFEYNSHIYLPQPKKDEVAKINCPQKYGKLLTPTGIDIDIQAVVDNIESGNFHEAAYKVSKITTEYPDYYYGYYLTGVVMAGLEQEKDAISMFERAIKINPYDFESMASLGQIYYSEAEKYLSADYVNKSVGYFEKAIKQNPNCYVYHFYLGLNNLLLSRNDKAIAEFDKAISMKSNDYNSMYYKLIAQYLKGDNNGVVEGSAKLLNKHVSNSNSVLYLRALANYRLGKNDEALSDIENVFSNMNDLYNADIKRVSAKEQTLPSYLYLLKAQILKSKGDDSSQDFAKAYENPIIRTMTRNINTEINISPVDFENQLDYIRTAFIDKKVMMKYMGSEYKVSNLGPKDSSAKSSNAEDTVKEGPSNLALALATGELNGTAAEDKTAQISMKQTTSQEEMISEEQSTISQMLATQSVPKAEPKEVIAKTEEAPEILKSDFPSEFKITYDNNHVYTIKSIPEVSFSERDELLTAILEDIKKRIQSESEREVLKIAETKEEKVETVANVDLAKSEASETAKTEFPSEYRITYEGNHVYVIKPIPAGSSAEKDEMLSAILDDMRNQAQIEPEQVVSKISETKQKSTETIANNIDLAKPEIIESKQTVVKNYNITYDNQPPAVALKDSEYKPEELVDIEDLMQVNSFENMDEPIIITENKQEILPVVSTPIISYQKPVENIPVPKISSEEPVKAVAQEIKETPDFKISYDEQTPPVLRQPAVTVEPVAAAEEKTEDVIAQANEIVKQEQKVQEDITKLIESHLGGSSPDIEQIINNVQENPEIKEISDGARKINEKYADVDLNEFNVKKPVLKVESTDEIIVFEPNTFIEKAEEKLATDDFGIKDPTKQITDNFAQIQKQAKEYADSVIAESNTESEKVQKYIEESKEEAVQTIAPEKEPELIVPEVVVSEPVQKINKETEKVAVKTIEKTSKVVPSVRVEQPAESAEIPKETIVAQSVSEAQQVLDEFENKQRTSVENESEKIVSTAENKDLWDFLSDDFDAENVSKAKDKKLKKISRRSKKEAQVASIVQETLVGDAINYDIEETCEPKTKKSWFKRTKKAEKDIEGSVENISENVEKKTKSFKNIFKRNKDAVKSDIDDTAVQTKKILFKHKEKSVEAVNNSVQKEQKKINWFKKKEKNIDDSFDSLEPQKEKKTFSLKKLFRRTKSEE